MIDPLPQGAAEKHTLAINNLREHKTWLPLIAIWHHNEWLRTYDGMEKRQHSPESVAHNLVERKRSLSKHLGDDILPTTFVASLGDRPLGTVSLVYYQLDQSSEPTEWLTNLYVIPKFRQMGIASKLLRTAIDYANANKLSRLLLYTADRADFYKKRQWRSINRGIVQGQKVEIMDYVLRL
jgi:GNAT superfamily N-acetyltransferase